MTRVARAALPAIVLAAAIIPAQSLSASSVVEMSAQEMADHAGQAIVGVVRSVESYWAADPRRIESRIVLEQVEYLKGALPDADETFEFVVPGGTVGDTRMQVCCAPQFEAGQKWLLLLLPEYQTYPVVGLYQGAFEVVQDQAGVERVTHSRHGVRYPVVGLDERGFVRVAANRAAPSSERIKHETNLRVAEDLEPAADAAGVTWAEFAAELRPVLSASLDHSLTNPAGRRAKVSERVGVSLQAAETTSSPGRAGEVIRVGAVDALDASAAKRGSE